MKNIPAVAMARAKFVSRLSARLLSCSVAFSMATAGEPRVDALDELRSTVASTIRLLEKKQYEELLFKYGDPEVVKKAKETGTIGGVTVPEWSKQFGADKGPRLLDALRSIRDDEPVFDEGGKEATYEVGRPVLGSKTSVVFIKHKKGWYLRNY